MRAARLGVVLAMVCMGWACAPASPTPAVPAASAARASARELAKERYRLGAEAHRKGKFEQAIDLFLQAERLEHDPAMAFNIAVAYEDSGDAASALRWYRDYLREVPAAADRAEVEGRVARLTRAVRDRGLQQLTVLTSPAGAVVQIDGRPVGLSPWTGELAPGAHAVAAEHDGYARESARVELHPHRAMDVQLTLRAGEPSGGEKGWRIGPATWTMLGLSVATLAAGTVLEVTRSRYESESRHETSPNRAHDMYDTSKRLETSAHILLGASVVLMTGFGLLLHLDARRTDAPARAAMGLGCDGARCGAVGFGRF